VDPDPGLAVPHESLESLLEMPVADLARRLGVDPARLEAVFDRVARQTRAQANTSLLSLGVSLLPHVRLALLDAFAHLPAETALQLFEEEDLLELVGRWGLVHAILDDPAFLTIHELADILDECAVHFERNRSSLVTMGVPQTTLGASWPGMLLQYLYPTGFVYQEKQAVVVDAGRASPRHDALKHLSVTARATRVHTYVFDRVVGNTVISTIEPSTIDQSLLQWGPYEQVGRYPDLNEETASRIEAGRSRFLDLEIDVLRVLAKELRRTGNVGNLWSRCLSLLTEAFPADDVAFYLEIDQWAYGYDIASGESQGDGALHPFPGGLSQLLVIIGHCEKELSIGPMHHTKRLMPHPVLNEDGFRTYFQAIGQPWQASLDYALDQLLALSSREAAFWNEYQQRVNEAIPGEFKARSNNVFEVPHKYLAPFERQMQKIGVLVRASLELNGVLPELQTTIQLSAPVTSETEPEYVFHRDDDTWTLGYAGRTAHVSAQTIGLDYLAYLLRRPGRKISVLELDAAIRGNLGPAAHSYSQASITELGDGFQEVVLGDDGIPLIDEKGIKLMQAERRKLKNDLTAAIQSGNQDAIANVTSDLSFLDQYLRGTIDVHGSPRTTGDTHQKVSNNVPRRIRDAIKHVRKKHPQLAEHLKASIKTGASCSYEPIGVPHSWMT
jgi:hypothetical protein